MSRRGDDVSGDAERVVASAYRAPAFDSERAETVLANARALRELHPRRSAARLAAAAAAGLAVAVLLLAATALWPLTLGRQTGAPRPAGLASRGDGVLDRALAAVTDQRHVLHLVMVTGRDNAVDADVWAQSQQLMQVTLWVDPQRDLRRKSETSTLVNIGQPSTSVFRLEELDADGVSTQLTGDRFTNGTTRWNQVLIYDTIPSDASDPLQLRADLGVYQQMLSSAEATVSGSGDVSGTPTYELLVEHRPPTVLTSGVDSRGWTIRVDVRRSDYLPIRLRGEQWYLDATKGRVVQQRWTTRYISAESLAPTAVPARALRLDLPRGVPVGGRLTLTPARAAALNDVTPWWIGASFGGLSLTSLEYVRDDQWRQRMEFGTLRKPIELADQRRPRLGSREVIADYGTLTGPDIQVISMPHVPVTRWNLGSLTTTSAAVVGGRPAVRGQMTVRFNGTAYPVELLVFDASADTTIMLRGWQMRPGDLDRAAAALVRIPAN